MQFFSYIMARKKPKHLHFNEQEKIGSLKNDFYFTLGCLMPLSTIFQLYCGGGQFY
jgi:hypothetical protein